VALESASGKLITFGEFNASLQGVIRRINAEVEKPNEMIHLYFNGDSQLIADTFDETIAEEDEIIDGGSIYSAMSIDAVNKCITIPDNWIKILTVFQDGTSDENKMRSVPYDILKADGYTTDYTSINRNLYFNIDVADLELNLWLKIRRDYAVPERNVTEYTGMPENAYQLVYTGIVLSLLYRHKYYNPQQVTIYNAQWEELKYNFGMLNMTRPKPTAETSVT
jgi:hypothetical protein